MAKIVGLLSWRKVLVFILLIFSVSGKKSHPMEIKEAEYPPWLLPLLETEFYGRCVSHYKLENYFCYDCKEAFCEKCEKHTRFQDSHQTLHLYRASWYPAVETKDAKEWLDISDIQTFSINNHEVVYLNLRPRIEKEKDSNGPTNLCKTCQRVLKDKDKIRFCSISCKIKGNGLALQQIRGEKRIAAAVDPSTDLPPRRRRRKGIPQRAPFF